MNIKPRSLFTIFPANKRMKLKGIQRPLISLVLILFSTSQAFAERTFVEATLNDNRLEIILSDTKLTITPINKGTVEVFYQPEGFESETQLPSFALPEAHSVYTQSELVSTATGYRFILPDVTVTVTASPFTLSFSNETGLLASEEIGMFANATMRGFRFELAENEAFLGGGQRVLGMNRRGYRMPLYNRAHYGYTTESNQMYYSLPAVMSSKAYVIAFDNSANRFLDIGHTEKDILQFEADAGRTAYIFSASKIIMN
ncbi:MAG: oligosaccharide 4-alpha-D-glucosyltransferase [Alphaproteobacteria bacterium]|jgi:oligosaccharide 4-alpha-D-glucosyltransferase